MAIISCIALFAVSWPLLSVMESVKWTGTVNVHRQGDAGVRQNYTYSLPFRSFHSDVTYADWSL